MDQLIRAREPRLIDLVRAGVVSIRTVKRLATCGNRDAQLILGFTRKPKVHLVHVLKVMLADCPERVTLVTENLKVTSIEEMTSPKVNAKYWHWNLMLMPRPTKRYLAVARSLIKRGLPGFWKIGKLLAAEGRKI